MSFQQFTIATLCKGLLYGSYMRRPLAPTRGCILGVHHVCSAANPLFFWDFDPCDANRAKYLWLIRDRQALVYIPFFRCVKISGKKHLWCVSKHCGGQFFASYWGRLWTGKGAVPYFNICLFKLCPINFSHVDFDKSIFPSIFFRWCSSSFMSIWKRQRSIIWIAALILIEGVSLKDIRATTFELRLKLADKKCLKREVYK